MTPFINWLSQLPSLISTPAAWGIFLTGAGIYLINEWRIRFLMWGAQYFFVGILFARIFDTRPEMALLKTLVGWLICGAFLISARVRGQTTPQVGPRWRWSSNLPFRILSLLTMTVVAYLASQKYPLPFISADLALACFILIVLAILFIGTEEDDALVTGVGVLNLLSALDIFYSSQDPGLLVTGLLVMVNLLIGLAASYLAVVEVAE
ncbi:MAG TPA: hypothetical protein PLH19_07235 [Anaerolineae bacterium]|nr:hypothetical protein [Anaerolineae bacterium]HQH38316.1 hypothetical protein [Anaerolineae bacterium]